MIKQLLFCTSLLLIAISSGAQDSFSVRAQRYIEQYYNMAMAEQKRAGIPASVTLAQGVLETEAGRSELACNANNHFGIKCKSDYQGDKFFHDDDRPKECFKMYRCAEDSYKDHSDYLKRNQRYTPLFSLSQTDYASWAICLKKCGYATNPQYAQRLIKIIEDFKLQQYTYAAMDSSFMPSQPVTVAQSEFRQLPPKQVAPVVKDTAKKIVLTTFDPAPKPGAIVPHSIPPTLPQDTIKKMPPQVAAAPAPVKEVPAVSFEEIKRMADSAHKIVVNNDVAPAPVPRAMPAAGVDTPKKDQTVTTTIDTRYDSGKIITVNGLKAFYAFKGEMLLQYAVKYNIRYQHLLEINDLEDGPLPANMLVYLEKKLASGTHAKHTVKEGETILMVAQAEGIQLRRIQLLNMLDIGDEPAVGTILELQNGANRKPGLRAAAPGIENMTTRTLGKSTPPDQLITIDRPKPAVKAADTIRQLKTQAYVETVVPKQAKPADTVKPIATPAVETVANAQLKIAEPAPVTPAPAKPAPLVEPLADAAAAAKQEDTAKDELAALKAELDKVVYTNDSNLISSAKTTAKPVVEKVVPAKPVKDAKKPAVEKASKYYIVKKGETLSGIANRNNTTVKKIMKWNDVEPEDLRPGQKLRVKE